MLGGINPEVVGVGDDVVGAEREAETARDTAAAECEGVEREGDVSEGVYFVQRDLRGEEGVLTANGAVFIQKFPTHLCRFQRREGVIKEDVGGEGLALSIDESRQSCHDDYGAAGLAPLASSDVPLLAPESVEDAHEGCALAAVVVEPE